MKKRVTAELISIAHRILKLKNHSETVQLQQEAKNLYDQLTILRFYEENFEMVKNEISEEVLEAKLEGKQADVFEQPIPVVEEVRTNFIFVVRNHHFVVISSIDSRFEDFYFLFGKLSAF